MAEYAGSSTVTLAAATSTQVMADRQGRRIAFSIANVGANAAYLTLSNTENAAVDGQGIYLAPGGILSDSYAGDVQPWQGNVLAISTAGSTLAVWERVQL